jgi:16S rRNA (cytidine1402-2'-O)-methyltransferase
MNKGKLYLIPNIIANDTQHIVTTPQILHVLPTIRHFLVEDPRNARRYISSLKVFDTIEDLDFEVLDKDTKKENLPVLFKPASQGLNVGVISEAGCPGVADPGALAVMFAHESNIEVVPLVGPSSLLLALMSSGLNGQRFAFHGYLPINVKECAAAIRAYEQESRQKNQTQIFIETPYRNIQLKQTLMNNLRNETMLSIAVDLTGAEQQIKTRLVSEWKVEKEQMPKLPAVFMFLAL